MVAGPMIQAPASCSSSFQVPTAFRRPYRSCSKEQQKTGKRRRVLPEVPKQTEWLDCSSQGNRVYAISDLHTDYRENMDWIRRLSTALYQKDTLIVAGDVSENLQTFKRTMGLLKEKFARVFFVPGNHDLWCRGKEHEQMDSLQKLGALNAICDSLSVETKPKKVNKVWIVPLLSWYHQSFDKEKDIVGYHILSLEKTCIDYHACKWPDELKVSEIAIASHFDKLNSSHVREISQTTDQVITFSHFLPRPELCPEKRMLYYPNLPKVIGSDLLEERLRSIHGCNGNSNACHVFGHTHFCWDATIDGIRYLQAPLGYPRERQRRINGGEAWLPLCVYDNRLVPGPMPCYWSDYYRVNKRDPNNTVLAPWVADKYHSDSKQ